MDDYQFYPTPRDLAEHAWATFKNRDFVRVLEPSAGEGHLAEAQIKSWHSRSVPMDVCELDMTKHPLLRDKKFDVIASDFMSVTDGSIYSHIIMNPPFAEGAKHVLHAWDILYDGEIVAILNAETIRNPFSVERRFLVDLIEQHGSVEFIQEAFTEAERTTDVEIALVYLCKKVEARNLFGNLIEDLKKEADAKLGYKPMQEVALLNNDIENQVVVFNAAVVALKAAVQAEAKAGYYAQLLGDTMAVRNQDKEAEPEDKSVSNSVAFIQNEFGSRYLKLKDRAWASVLRSAKLMSKLSSKAQKRLEAEFEDIKKLEFTTENIYGFMRGILESASEIQLGMCLDVFDEITRYHSENRVFYRGWKSNNEHRTCGFKLKAKRFILPRHQPCYGNDLSHGSYQLLADFDKVFAMLDGKAEPEKSLVTTFKTELATGKKMVSSYFECRWFKGIGTIHFYPTRPDLIDRLNRIVGRERQWLPEQEENNDFWKQYHQAEKFDDEIIKAINTVCKERHISSWDNPIDRMERFKNDDDQGKSLDIVNAAIDSVLLKHGIEPFAGLTDQNQNLCLELLAA